MGCPRCGWLNRAGAEFCANCGASLGTPQSPAEAQAHEPNPADAPPDPNTTIATAGALAASGAVVLPGFPPVGARQDQPPAQAEPSHQRTEPRPYLPMAGPADRESFFAAMRRHRRATWRMTIVCVFGAIMTGVPLSLIITPLLFSVIIIVTALVNIVVSVPAAVWDFYGAVVGVIIEIFRQFDDTATDVQPLTAGDIALAATAWIAPGVILMLLIWPAIRELFDNVGVGMALLALGAREPQAGDLEERQLVNVVEEMALAAGLPAPRVRLIDSYVANAAVVGSSPRDATLIVSRPLLDDLDRGETQGVLADLIASIGNGDLGIAQSIIAVFQTFGFVTAFLKAPISPSSRWVLWRMLRFTFGRRSSPNRVADAERLTRELTGGIASVDDKDFSDGYDPAKEVHPKRGPQLQWLAIFPMLAIGVVLYGALNDWSGDRIRALIVGLVVIAGLIVLYQLRYLIYILGRALVNLRLMILLPYYMAVMMPQMLLMMFSSFILQPLLSRTWRTRRYLADATAVQLTRNPDWVADGLLALVQRGGVIPGGRWAIPLFVVGPEVHSAKVMTPEQLQRNLKLHDEMETARKSGNILEMQRVALQASGAGEGVAAAAAPAEKDDQIFGMGGSLSGYHPKINDRLKRLRKLGAGVDPEASEAAYEAALKQAGRRGRKGWQVLLVPLFAVLGIVVVVLMLVVIALLTGLSLLFTSIMMLIPYGLLEWLRP